ncbi:MAG TPA: SPOR domain-containing protein, partial [Candidatus Krumholzibacteria bacterium]|nr:SPOR domain-containing protein [Candidatus Krumholzibacteria bacterium]
SLLLPRIAMVVFGLLVIAFVVWWFLQDHSLPGLTDTGEKGGHPAAADSVQRASATTPDTLAASSASGSTMVMLQDTSTVPTTDTTMASAPPRRPLPAPANPADTAGRTGGTMLVNSSDIQVMEDLDHRFHGWYVIHISSFQTSVRARDEVAFLESHEFPVFIVFLDLGVKGKWYRVYAGPFQTREEAQEVKKNLDAIPQVRFTRIASIPD